MRTACRSSIPRRAVLAAGLLALAAPRLAAAAPLPARLAFAVLRNGKRIGEQSMTFDAGDGLLVRTVLELTVKLGPIVAYRYRHDATERWRGEAFDSLQTRTNDNGHQLQVSARRDGAAVRVVQASGATVLAAPRTLPFSHWNRRIAGAPLFNPQDGKLLVGQAAPGRQGQVVLADGSRLPAQSLVFRGEAYIEDWYDQEDVWTGLDSRLKDGSSLVYRRL